LVNVAQAWAEAYKVVDSSVAIAVTGGGSGTGISSMINGTVDIANASRAMKSRELDSAKNNGVDPKKYVVGHDAIAVYLHKSNPISEFTLSQLQIVYEIVLQEKLDKRNFRKKILNMAIIEESGKLRHGDHRPAKLYRFSAAAIEIEKARRRFP
jgi:phosphate transport system substrate-binding protein